MKRLKIFAAAAALIFAAGCSAEKEQPAAASPALTSASGTESAAAPPVTEESYIPRADMLECSFYDSPSFAIYDARAPEYPSEKPIACGVVPHHLTAGHLISGFFKAAAKSRSDVETVVVIATSHYEGGNQFYTTLSDWNSPFGIVKTDKERTEALMDGLGAVCDDARLVYDHSASAHIPFISRYFPDAKTACLLVAPGKSINAPEKLAEVLSSLPDADKCLFLFSIDFSHYLTMTEADKHDSVTRKAVSERDYTTIEQFGNSNVDSPICLSAYLRLSDLLEKEVTEADNSNTVRVNETPYSETAYSEGVTSYFIFMSR